MTGAFEWLNRIFEWLWQFVPRLEVVDTRYGAVKFNTIRIRDLARMHWDRSVKVQVLGPGFHVWWPVFTNWDTYPVKQQTMPVSAILFSSADEPPVTLMASGVLTYDVVDLAKLLVETYDPDDTLADTAQTTLHDVLCHVTYSDLRKGQGRTLDTKLKNAAKKDLEPFGVNVTKFTLSSLAPARVHRLIQSTRNEGELR